MQTRTRWWSGPAGRTRVLIAAFGALGLFGILIGAVNTWSEGDQRVLVVTMKQGISYAERDSLKQACGSLPGISVVADRGATELQYRFPVRFSMSGATPAQESALTACITAQSQYVRGYLTEGDGR